MLLGRRSRDLLLIVAGGVAIALLTLALAPVLTRNVLFLAALPVISLLFLVLVLNAHTTFLFVLWTRSLMDPVLSFTKVGGGTGIGGLLNLFVIVMTLLLVFRFPKTLAGERHVRPWLAFLAIGASTLLFAPLPFQSVRFWLNMVTYLCMFSVPFFIVKNERGKKFWIKTLLYSSFLPTLMALVGLVTKWKFLYVWGRLSGTFTHANILAFYVVFAVALTTYALRMGIVGLKLPTRLAYWAYIAVLLAVLVTTETRSAWMACGIFFFVYGLLKDRRILLGGFLIGVLMLGVPQVQSRIKDLTQGTGVRRSEKLNSAAWRIRLWQDSIPSIKKRLLVGHGLDSFQLLSKDFFELERRTGAPAHSVYVQLLFEVGLFGLLAYLWIYARILRTFYRRMRTGVRELSHESALLIAYLAGYLVVSVSDNMLYYLAFNWYFWFFIGLVVHAGSFRPPSGTRAA